MTIRRVSVGISTKRGDTGFTSTLSGKRIPKHHIITEAVGAVDEANSLLGLARASVSEKKIKRIILQIQKHLFAIGAELSLSGGNSGKIKKRISINDLKWVERLVEEMEEALSLPPGFVAFGQEITSSHLDVARTGIRKVERIVVKMQSEGYIANPFLVKYLNRISDLLFLLAAYEEKSENERKGISLSKLTVHLNDSFFRRWFILGTAIIISLVVAIFLLLLFHKPSTNISPEVIKHMENMHSPTGSLSSGK